MLRADNITRQALTDAQAAGRSGCPAGTARHDRLRRVGGSQLDAAVLNTMRALTIALCLLATPALADVTGPARVTDGDTLEVQGQRIRLHGIDAPESRQLCRLNGYAVWRRVVRAVGELLSKEQPAGTSVR